MASGTIHAGNCPVRGDGKCMNKEKLPTWQKIFAAGLGTLPGLFIVIFRSRGFQTVAQQFPDNVGMTLALYGILLLMWLGTIGYMAHQEQPTLGAYIQSSAAYLSTIFGVGATVFQLLIPS